MQCGCGHGVDPFIGFSNMCLDEELTQISLILFTRFFFRVLFTVAYITIIRPSINTHVHVYSNTAKKIMQDMLETLHYVYLCV